MNFPLRIYDTNMSPNFHEFPPWIYDTNKPPSKRNQWFTVPFEKHPFGMLQRQRQFANPNYQPPRIQFEDGEIFASKNQHFGVVKLQEIGGKCLLNWAADRDEHS